MADLRSILLDVKTDQKWSETKVAVASSCDEPSWARDCIQKFGITDKIKLKDIFDPNLTEIYKGSKSGHLKTIGKESSLKMIELVHEKYWLKKQSVNNRVLTQITILVFFL